MFGLREPGEHAVIRMVNEGNLTYLWRVVDLQILITLFECPAGESFVPAKTVERADRDRHQRHDGDQGEYHTADHRGLNAKKPWGTRASGSPVRRRRIRRPYVGHRRKASSATDRNGTRQPFPCR